MLQIVVSLLVRVLLTGTLYTTGSDMTLLFPLLCFLSPWFGSTSALHIRPHGVVTVSEGKDALLPCALDFGKNIDKFDWRKDNEKVEKNEVFFYDKGSHYNNGLQGQNEQFKDRVVFFQHELKSGNASVVIKNTRLEDNGTYTCVLFEPQQQEIKLRLNVGAAPVPYCNQVPLENSKILLECKAQGVPKPEVEWRNSAGEVFPAEVTHVARHEDASGHFHVELQVNVSRSDTYTCVVTQKDIYHQVNRTVKVHIPDAVEAVAVSEGDDAVLPCFLDSKHSSESMVFSWKKGDEEVLLYDRGRVKEGDRVKGRFTLFQQELKSGNASIKIYNTQKSDSGRYTCYFPDIQKSHAVLQVVETSHVWKIISGVIGFFLIVAVIVVGVLAKLLCKKNTHNSNTKETLY